METGRHGAARERTMREAGLRLGEVSQACVGGALEVVEPGQVLLLAQGGLLRLQGPLQGETLLLEGQLQTALLLHGHREGVTHGATQPQPEVLCPSQTQEKN